MVKKLEWNNLHRSEQVKVKKLAVLSSGEIKYMLKWQDSWEENDLLLNHLYSQNSCRRERDYDQLVQHKKKEHIRNQNKTKLVTLNTVKEQITCSKMEQ